MEKRNIITLLMIPCIFILFWLGAIAKCEILTNLHGGEFKIQSEFVMDSDIIKVLNYSKTTAKVYYFTPKEGGIVFNYTKINNLWDQAEEIACWSSSGTADDVIWPYAYHSVEGKGLIIFISFLSFIFIIILLCLLLKHRKL